jgi:hypothetical protein
MKCDACEMGDHGNCNLSVRCTCDCDGEAIDYGLADLVDTCVCGPPGAEPTKQCPVHGDIANALSEL